VALAGGGCNNLAGCVILNRFFAADFVFILGILLLRFCIETGRRGLFQAIQERPRHALPDRSDARL